MQVTPQASNISLPEEETVKKETFGEKMANVVTGEKFLGGTTIAVLFVQFLFLAPFIAGLLRGTYKLSKNNNTTNLANRSTQSFYANFLNTNLFKKPEIWVSLAGASIGLANVVLNFGAVSIVIFLLSCLTFLLTVAKSVGFKQK